MAKDKGTPSAGLQEMMDINELAKEDFSGATEAAPEKGIFYLVGGFIDQDGKLNNEVQLRAITGREEDIIANMNASNIVPSMNELMVSCTERIGSITGKEEIRNAILNMPSGSRTHLLICIRVVSHWDVNKDTYVVEAKCPACRHAGHYSFSLMEIEQYDWEEPKMEHEVVLPGSKKKVVWHVMTGVRDEMSMMLSSIRGMNPVTAAMMVRIKEIDGKDCWLDSSDVSGQPGRVRLSKKAKWLLNELSSWTIAHRDFIRAEFLDHEPSVETEVDFMCENCGEEFSADLNIASASFFFPQVTSRRWKRKRSS